MIVQFPNKKLHELEYLKYEHLVTELNKENNWLRVAESIDLYSGSKIEHFSRNGNPAKALLQELVVNNCTIGILGEILNKLNILSALSIICFAEKVKIISEPSRIIYCTEGETILLECQATGNPLPSYRWMKSDTVLCSDKKFKIDRMSLEKCGEYRCLVYNQISQEYTKGSSIKIESIELNERKVAIVIGNENYLKLDRLKVDADINTISEILRKIGFYVIDLSNRYKKTLIEKIAEICKKLHPNSYVLLYYAGHGFQLNGKYIMPIDSTDFNISEGISENLIIKYVLESNPLLFVFMLDMCLNIPPGFSDSKEIYVEEPLHNWRANGNLIRCYSTTDKSTSFERDGQSIYMKFLKRWLPKKLSIIEILKNVNEDFQNESSDAAHLQIPMYIDNTNKDFCLHDAPNVYTENYALVYINTLSQICTCNFDSIFGQHLDVSNV